MSATEAVHFSNISASTSAFTLKGGRYAFAAVATFGGGTIKLQALGPDGTTYIDSTEVYEKADGVGGTADYLARSTLTAAGMRILDLPPGQYRLTIATASAVYASVVSVPLT